MKWQLSNETSELIHGLSQVDKQRSWFGMRKQSATISSLLRQIAERDEIGAIAAMPHFLLSDSPEVRAVTGQAIARLLSVVPAEDLPCLDEVSDWSWSWTIGDRKIQPTMVRSLVADVDVRTSILGLISFHRNGYVRHEAVRLLAEVHDGTELAYLLIRLNDWVEPIRRDAQAAIEQRLVNDNLVHFVRNVSLVIRLLALRRHDHSSIVRRVVEMLVEVGNEECLLSMLRSSNRRTRRCVVTLALDLVGKHHARIVRFGVTSDDPVLRVWCCRLVRPLFAAGEAKEVLEKLKRDRFHPVRSEAYRNEAEGQPDEAMTIWKEALLDSSRSVRELARWQLGKLGLQDVAAVYRNALARTPHSLPALLGLGETGNESDLSVIRSYLKATLSSRRRAAIRGLARVGGDAVTDELIECLQDDSPTMAREVRQRLEEPGRVLKGELLLAIVNEDGRLHCRQEAIRAIFSMGKWKSLPWLIRAAGHSDRDTAAFAHRFIENWFSPPLCNKVWTRPSSDEKENIDAALSQTRTSIDLPLLRRLDGWLGCT
jgi:HEAT repeat protein